MMMAGTHNLDDAILIDRDWETMETLVMLLHPVKEYTTLVGGVKYPTLALAYELDHLFVQHLSEFQQHPKKDLVKDLFESLRMNHAMRFKTWPRVGLLALKLDPRFKLMVGYQDALKRSTLR